MAMAAERFSSVAQTSRPAIASGATNQLLCMSPLMASSSPQPIAACRHHYNHEWRTSPLTTRYFSTHMDTTTNSSSEIATTESEATTPRQSIISPLGEDLGRMTNEQLADTASIPGWDLVHAPPKKFPRGALVGRVVSTKMQKTVNVAVDRYRIAPKIRKRERYTRKFMAHDEGEVANLGDIVMIVPCHRISKHKHFMLHEIIRARG